MTVPQLRRSSLHLFLHSEVSIYKVHIHCIYHFMLIFPRYITNQLNEQLPVGLQSTATSFPALFLLSPSYFISEKALGTRLTALHRSRWGQGSDPRKTEFFLSSFRNCISCISRWSLFRHPAVPIHEIHMFIISIILKTEKSETDDALIRQPAPHPPCPSPDCLSIFAPFYGFHRLT